MKKYIVSLLVGIATVLAGCSYDEMELNKGDDLLTLTAGRSEANMNIRTPNAEAQKFNWTTGTNQGTGTAISYTFEMDLQGNNFAGGYKEEIGKKMYSKSFTVNELNHLILEELKRPFGSAVTLEARVIAVVADPSVEQQVSEVVTFTALPFKPAPTALYLIGDATPNGWSADDATPMNVISNEAGGFIWSGQLSRGEMKFITTLGSFSPSYNKGADDNTLLLRESDDQPDDKFVIESAGMYRVKLNVLDLTISIAPMAGPKYEMIWFVGSYTGWSFEPMMQDKVNPFLFKLGRVMTWNDGGEFKFGTASGSWDNMYHPTIPNAPYTHTAVVQDDSGDMKWMMSEEESNKPYKMVLDITEGSETLTMSPFEPFEMIYLVGEATPNGWDIGNATPMTAVDGDPFTFIWTGTLKTGEMKFSCDKQSDWGGAWFLAYENGIAPSVDEQQMVFSAKGDGGNDRKWNIVSAGSYTIILDQLREVVTIIKN